MPNEDELAEAVLQNVENSSYPESDGIISADLPPAAITSLLRKLSLARESVKGDIRALGGEAAPDIDGWITQAKQIQADIERSKETARNIVKEAEASKDLRIRVQDAASKVGLLENELIFNESLTATIEYVKSVTETLRQAQNAAEQDRIRFAIEKLREADIAIKRLTAIENTRAYGILQRQIDQLRSAIMENLDSCWNALIVVDSSDKFISIKNEINRQIPISMSAIVEAMSSLELLDSAIDRLSIDLDNIVFAPRLTYDSTHQPSNIAIRDNNITVSGKSSNPTASNALADLSLIVEYLNARLPSTIILPLSGKLLPLITSRLVSGWLERSIPISVEGVTNFQDTVSHVQGLIERLKELGWEGWDDLDDWVDRIPDLWLAKRKEVAIDDVRRLCKTGYKTRKSVTREETRLIALPGTSTQSAPNVQEVSKEPSAVHDYQNIRKDTSAVSNPQPDDAEDWNAEFDFDDDTEETKDPVQLEPEPKLQPEPKPSNDVQEESYDAWELNGNDKEDEHNQEEDNEEWDEWAEDEVEEQVPTTREITHRETYTITDIPDALFESIVKIVTDVKKIYTPQFHESSVAPAAVDLYTIPALILAMYRALATATYTVELSNMLIHNDCIRLADRLKAFTTTLVQHSSISEVVRASAQLRLENEINAIEGFGSRAYKLEMETQENIIWDFINMAQSFAHCTATDERARACQGAVTDTVDRLYQLNKQWTPVLSHSRRLKSVGSLLSAVVNKMVVDIADMTIDDRSGISEEESKRLADFCEQVAEVKNIFVEEGSADEPDPARYTSEEKDWFRFDYLSEILLADLETMQWLWINSRVSEFFSRKEIIDFIKALFSDTDYRKNAIHAIRTTDRETPKQEIHNR